MGCKSLVNKGYLVGIESNKWSYVKTAFLTKHTGPSFTRGSICLSKFWTMHMLTFGGLIKSHP